MPFQAVVISGLPSTCNPVKVKLRFEAECKVQIKGIKVESKKATIEFASEKDHDVFIENFPKSIKFGNEQHKLRIQPPENSLTNPSLLHSAAKSEEPLLWTHKHIQHWSTLERLPSCRSGLLVQPSDETISPKGLLEYFENNQESCGGPIQEMIPMIDGIFIVFKDEQADEKAWNFRPHRICGKNVTVYRKLVPVPFQNKIVIKVRQSGDLETDKLKLLFEQCSPKHTPVKGMKKFFPGVFLAVYENVTDEHDIEETVKEFKRKNPSYDVSFLTRSDCIRIHSLPRDISDYELRILFENQERTSGGVVTRIDRFANSESLVYFSSYKDAESIVDRFQGKTLPVFDARMKLRLHFQSLQANQMDREQHHPLDQHYNAWLTPKAGAVRKSEDSSNSSFWVGDVNGDILRFFIKNIEHQQMLNFYLRDFGVAKVAEHGIKVVLKKAEASHELVVRDMVKDFMKSYISKRCEVNHEMRKQIADSQSDGVCIRYVDSSKREMTVTGLKAEVESFTQSLQNNPDIHSLHLDENVIKWLVKTGTLEQLKKDYVEIDKCTQNEVKFSGDEEKLFRARTAVMKLTEKLRYKRFTCDKPRFVQFLSEAKNNKRIATNVLEVFLRQKICAILVIKDEFPHILAPMDCTDIAIAVLSTALSLDETLEMQSASLNVAQMPGWKTIEALESEGKLRTYFVGNVLSIVGFLDHVADAAKKLSRCGFKYRKLIKMDQGMARHITQVVDDFQNLCIGRLISYHLSKDGIVVSGQKDEIETALDEMEKWKANLVKKVLTIETFGAVDFFDTKKGGNLLTAASTNYKATVVINSQSPPENKVYGGTIGYLSNARQVSSNEGISSVMIGPLKVSVRQGNITEETNDAIINSVGPDFDLSKGMLSKAILEKGGPTIQSDLSKGYDDWIRFTSNGKLKCKKVIHVVVPVKQRRFKEVIVDMLEKADKKKTESMSVPAIGTGAGKFACDVVAKLMLESIDTFSKKFPKNLRTMDIVLFEQSQVHDFKRELLHFSKKGRHAATSNPVTYQPVSRFPNDDDSGYLANANKPLNVMKIGPISVSVRQGDITEERNHAIINSAGHTFDLSKGMVSQAIIRKGGVSIQKEVKEVEGSRIRVTSAGRLKCIKIFHVVTPTEASKIKEIGVLIKHILDKAEKELCPSLSIPAIGTGNLGMPVPSVAKIMLKAICEFVDSSPITRCLHKVDFVIYDRVQVKEFRDAVFHDLAVPETRLDKSKKNFLELLIYSEKDRAEEVADWIKLKLKEALENTITHDSIARLTSREDEFLTECMAKFNVSITRSSDKIIIEGLGDNAFRAKTKVRDFLQRFSQSQSRFGWQYCDDSGIWQKFGASANEEIENAYQKFLQHRFVTSFAITIKSASKLVNFTTMKIDHTCKIKRLDETDVDFGRMFPVKQDHNGQSAKRSQPDSNSTRKKRE